MSARKLQLAALRSRVSRSLAVNIVTDFNRSADALSRHASNVSFVARVLRDAVIGLAKEISPVISCTCRQAGAYRLSVTKRLPGED
jgi:hypothetical protein